MAVNMLLKSLPFLPFGAKHALRDVLKRFGVPEYELSAITKKISFRDNLKSAYEGNLQFRQQINSKLEYQKPLTLLVRLRAIQDKPQSMRLVL